MLHLKTLNEVRTQAPEAIVKETEALFDNIAVEDPEFVCSFEDFENDAAVFDSGLGGDIFIVETEEDLKQIEVLAGIDKDGNVVEWLSTTSVRNANITETPSDFDAADLLAPDGDYAALFMATNNAGGPVYYIPRSVYEQCPNVMNSIILHNGGKICYYSMREELQDKCREEDASN